MRFSYLVILAVLCVSMGVTISAKRVCKTLWKDGIPDACVYESTIPGDMEFKVINTDDADEFDTGPNWRLIRGTSVHPDFTITEKIIMMDFYKGNMKGSIFFGRKSTDLKETAKYRSDENSKKEHFKGEYTWFVKPDDKDVEKSLEEQNKHLIDEEKELDKKLAELKWTFEKAKLCHENTLKELQPFQDLRNSEARRKRWSEMLNMFRKEIEENEEEVRKGCSNSYMMLKSIEGRIKSKDMQIKVMKDEMEQKKQKHQQARRRKESEERSVERPKQLDARRKAKNGRNSKKASNQNELQKSLGKMLQLKFGSKSLFYKWYHGLVDKQLQEMKSRIVYKIHERIANLIRRLVGLDRVGLDDHKFPYTLI